MSIFNECDCGKDLICPIDDKYYHENLYYISYQAFGKQPLVIGPFDSEKEAVYWGEHNPNKFLVYDKSPKEEAWFVIQLTRPS